MVGPLGVELQWLILRTYLRRHAQVEQTDYAVLRSTSASGRRRHSGTPSG
jgi:hypothetical protein